MRELAGGGPLVDIGVHVLDYSLFFLGDPAVRAVSASTYDMLASARFGSNTKSAKTGATDAKTFDVEDLATVFMRLHDGGTLRIEASRSRLASMARRRRLRCDPPAFGSSGSALSALAFGR